MQDSFHGQNGLSKKTGLGQQKTSCRQGADVFVMQKKYIIALGIVSLLVVGLCFLHFLTLDGLAGNFSGLLFEEDTVYASEYSNSKYLSIQNGMTKTEVVSIIGQPFYTNEDFKIKEPEERWWYSKSPGDTHYRMREVRFINDVVSRKVHYYHVD